MKKGIGSTLLLAIAIAACQKEEANNLRQVLMPERLGVNYNDTYPEHLANQFEVIDNDKADLGRVLFYDESLSINERVSCASCHIQSHAFADGKKNSPGFAQQNTSRNSLHITNIENFSPLFWDGRRNSLFEQVVDPITDHIEMGYGSTSQMIERISTKPYYADLFVEAFGTDQINEVRIREALTVFISSIRSYRNTLDAALAVLPPSSSPWSSLIDPESIRLSSEQENRGFHLFGELGCANCHSGHNIGGRLKANIGLDMEYSDQGFASWSLDREDRGVFRIPSLRNIALTAPYMHDGRFATLEEVIEHYNSNIKAHPNLDWDLQQVSEIDSFDDLVTLGLDPVDVLSSEDIEDNLPILPIRMNLSDSQKQDLLAFLHALTDKALINDTRYSNPFEYIE